MRPATNLTNILIVSSCRIMRPYLCAHGEVTSVAGHLLDASKGRAGDLVAADGRVDADEDAGLGSEISVVCKGVINAMALTSLIL